MEVYREETREFAVGDRIQFRAPLKAQQIPNGALGTIAALNQDTGDVTIALDAGPTFSTKLADLRHFEYGYATTSHSSQGATIDRVLVNVDTEQSVALVNQQQFYVSISRARADAQVFTNKTEELAQVVSRSWPKSTALDAITPSDDAARFSQRRENGPQHGVSSRREVQAQSHTVRNPQSSPVVVSPSEYTSQPMHGRHLMDAAQRVSHHQIDWRRERPDPVQEQAVTRTPAERRSEHPASQREETPKQQPERSRGIRYRI